MEGDGSRRWRLLALVVLAQLVVQVGFGANGVVLKLFAQGSDVHPLLFSFLRDLCASPALLLVAWAVEGTREHRGLRGASCLGRRINFPARPPEGILFAALGLTGMFLNQFLYIQGVYLTNATIAAIFQPAIPVFTVVLSMALGTEKLPSRRAWHGWAKVLGVCCAVAGAVAMVATAAPDEREGEGMGGEEEELAAWNLMLGNLSLIGNTVGMALYVVLQKRFVFYRHSSCEATESEGERTLANNCDSEMLVRFWERFTTVHVDSRGEVEASHGSRSEAPSVGAEESTEREELATEMEEMTSEIDEKRVRVNETGFTDGTDVTAATEVLCEEGEHGWKEVRTVALFHAWAGLPLTVTSWSYVSGTVFMGAASCVLLLLEPEAIQGINSGILFPLFYAVFISSTLCYCLVSWGNKHLSSTVVTAFWPLQIFVAATLGYLLLDERLNVYQAAGGAAILAGLAIVTTAEKFQRDAAAEALARHSTLVDHEAPAMDGGEWQEEGGGEEICNTDVLVEPLAETVPPEPLVGPVAEMRRKQSQ